MDPLHGGGVVHNGEAYLFTGISGAGKQTTIAALEQRGFRILGDDIANLFMKDNQVYIHPCFPAFKIWEESLQLLNRKNQGEYLLKSDMKKFLVPIKENFKNNPIKVKRIYHLLEDAQSEISFISTKGANKLNLFKINSYKPWAVKLFNLQKVHFTLINQMIPIVDWIEFTRPKTKETFEEVTNKLVHHITNE